MCLSSNLFLFGLQFQRDYDISRLTKQFPKIKIHSCVSTSKWLWSTYSVYVQDLTLDTSGNILCQIQTIRWQRGNPPLKVQSCQPTNFGYCKQRRPGCSAQFLDSRKVPKTVEGKNICLPMCICVVIRELSWCACLSLICITFLLVCMPHELW